MQFRDDVDANVAAGAEAIEVAAAAGAEIVCLPELATYIYFCHRIDPAYMEVAEPVPGPSTECIGEVAERTGTYVIFPLYERDTGDGQLYNTAVVIGPDGGIRGRYRKNSIPLVTTPRMDGIEKYYFRPGNLGYPVFETDLGVTIGITICYERHFPEGPRSLALAGADVIFVPTATANAREVWELELQGHAIANQLWVAGVNRVGPGPWRIGDGLLRRLLLRRPDGRGGRPGERERAGDPPLRGRHRREPGAAAGMGLLARSPARDLRGHHGAVNAAASELTGVPCQPRSRRLQYSR